MVTNDNQQIDPATACKRYRESATPAMCIQFERELTEKFGPTPEHAVADEAVKLWQKIFLEVGA